MTKHLFKILFLFTFLSGCQIAPLAYISVDPYSKPLQRKIKMPLNILLSEEVRDCLIVEGEGIKQMEVSEFRKSCIDGLKKVFEKNFETVNLVDKDQESGLCLIVYRLRPYWSRAGSSTSTAPNGHGGYNTITTSYISAAFQFESSLFLNGKKIANGDGKSFSEGQMSAISQAHRVFQDGLTTTLETINKMVFTDEIVDKINTPK